MEKSISTTIKHIPDLSCYNNNIYELSSVFRSCTHVCAKGDDDNTLSYLFGIINDGSFVQVIDDLYLNFQFDDIHEIAEEFEAGHRTLEEMLENHSSDICWLY